LNKGSKKFRKEGEKAIEKELEQLDTKDTFAPVNESDLTPKQKRAPLTPSCSLNKIEMVQSKAELAHMGESNAKAPQNQTPLQPPWRWSQCLSRQP
jgi:hypothetical protein